MRKTVITQDNIFDYYSEDELEKLANTDCGELTRKESAAVWIWLKIVDEREDVLKKQYPEFDRYELNDLASGVISLSELKAKHNKLPLDDEDN